MAVVLQFAGISKSYKSFWSGRTVRALDDFNLTVEAGEIFGFLGPNGAGKTTAIHLAMGFMRPTSGTGILLDQPFGHARTRCRVGFLPESVALYHQSASKLLRLYAELNSMHDPQLTRNIRRVLEAVDLETDADRNVAKFSRGMIQRIGLAQALVNNPEVLILDEPTSALDPLNRVAVREILIAARNAGKTTFLSSHLLSEIELICDRIGVLNHGRLIRVGRTADLLEAHDMSEICAVGQKVGSIPGAQAVEMGYRFIVPTAEVRRIIECVWLLGGEVVRINPVRRRLEDLFMMLTSESPQRSQPRRVPATEADSRLKRTGS